MNTLLKLACVIAAGLSIDIHADTTLVYDLVDAAGEKTQQIYTIRGRFLRVDKSTDDAEDFLLLDGGFLYMNVVDGKQGTFTTFGESPFHQGRQLSEKPPMEKPASPAVAETGRAAADSPPPVLAPTGQRDSVAGFRCMVVRELREDKVVAEHCMADAATLGMTPRELITMARLIDFSKEWTDPDWIALQSDEQFITIRSRPAGGDATFELKSVSHEIISRDTFRISPEYEKVKPADNYRGLITGRKKTD